MLSNGVGPALNWAYNLPPGGKLDRWLIFYVNVPNLRLNDSALGSVQFEQLILSERGYGGIYVGQGGYAGNGASVNTELVVLPNTS